MNHDFFNGDAGVLCSCFVAVGGRTKSGRVNRLPQNELPQFMQAFDEVFSGVPVLE